MNEDESNVNQGDDEPNLNRGDEQNQRSASTRGLTRAFKCLCNFSFLSKDLKLTVSADRSSERVLLSGEASRQKKQQAAGQIMEDINVVVNDDEAVWTHLAKPFSSPSLVIDSRWVLFISNVHAGVSSTATKYSQLHEIPDAIMSDMNQDDSNEGGKFTLAQSQCSASMIFNDEIVIGTRFFEAGITTLVMGLRSNGKIKEVENADEKDAEENKIIKMAKLNIMVRSALRNHFGNDVSVIDPINEIPCVQLSLEESNPNACPGPVVGEIIPCNNF